MRLPLPGREYVLWREADMESLWEGLGQAGEHDREQQGDDEVVHETDRHDLAHLGHAEALLQDVHLERRAALGESLHLLLAEQRARQQVGAGGGKHLPDRLGGRGVVGDPAERFVGQQVGRAPVDKAPREHGEGGEEWGEDERFHGWIILGWG